MRRLLRVSLTDIAVWVEARYPLRGYARLVRAPKYAPSLCSVAGLLLAPALQSRYEDTAPLPQRSETASPKPFCTTLILVGLERSLSPGDAQVACRMLAA